MTAASKARALATAAVLAAGAAGCGELFGPGDGESVSLSFTLPRPGTGVSASLGVADPITSGGHTLDLRAVQVNFTEIVLERQEGALGGDSDGDSDLDSDSDGPGNERFRRGPVSVELPLGGGVVTPLTEALPLGTYEEAELDVGAIRLTGTYDGQAFDVTVPVDAELELDFDPPFQVTSDADRLNVTITVDALRWLRETDGRLVDPRALAGDAALRGRFVRRVEASFDAFEDSDRDADDADSDSDSDD